MLVITGEAETKRLELLRRHWADLPLEWAHSLPLPQLATRLAAARVYLGHDTGPSHLAAAVGTRTVALFGPTDPALWAPRGPSVEIIQAPNQQLSRLPPETVLATLA